MVRSRRIVAGRRKIYFIILFNHSMNEAYWNEVQDNLPGGPPFELVFSNPEAAGVKRSCESDLRHQTFDIDIFFNKESLEEFQCRDSNKENTYIEILNDDDIIQQQKKKKIKSEISTPNFNVSVDFFKSKAPVVVALLYCALTEENAHFVDKEKGIINIKNWANFMKQLNIEVGKMKKKPTTDKHSRIKALGRHFEIPTKEGRKNNSVIRLMNGKQELYDECLQKAKRMNEYYKKLKLKKE